MTRQVQLRHVRRVLLTAQNADTTTVALSEWQQGMLEVAPRCARSREVGEEPKHGQVSLDVVVKVLVSNDALAMSCRRTNSATIRVITNTHES